ncbi:hypothetical protein KAR02_03860 [Candidatus Bipolaricaulota bacterium]|nr:hypothetical protein [Candidatus Bipolaricaulota bacterium]
MLSSCSSWFGVSNLTVLSTGDGETGSVNNIPVLVHPAKTHPLFAVQALILTMKGLKETLTLSWIRKIEAPHFFTVLAHGIARPFMLFMVD